MSILNFNNASANYEKIIFDFKVTDISGKEINLSKYKGKTI
jgi:glutathione peroxidase-family protein